MLLLNIQNMSMAFGGAPLFNRINLRIEQGERACLVGRNGEGKTTLLNIISGRTLPDDGNIYRQPGLKIASLAQEIPSRLVGRVFDIVTGNLEASGKPGGETVHAIENQTQAKKAITQLKLDPESDFKTLSAGMKRRVLLARALACSPDMLLLDEPTNHMDIDSIGLIEGLLAKFPGALLFVTHDRVFLRKIATRIIEIDRAALTSWSCGYDMYIQRKAERAEIEANQNREFDKKLATEEVWIRQGVKARRTRNEGRVQALLKMREERQNRRDSIGNVKMQIQESERAGKLVIEAKDVSLTYGEKHIIQDFSVTIMRGDRVGVIGPNGSGKTTLLNLLLNRMSPDNGVIRHGTNLEISYFDQIREQLDEEKSVQENATDGGDFIVVNGNRRHVIGYLKDFLFSPDRSRSPVKTLSGGERNRLLLARLFARPSNLLVMDEPTNDLDIETLELLEDLLIEYSGTLLLVSHDRAFLNNVVTSTLVFEENGIVAEYVGGYDDWLRQKKKKQLPPTQSLTPVEKKKMPSSAGQRKLGYKEKRELETLPEQIEAMDKELKALFNAMADPLFYKKNSAEIAAEKARMHELEALIKKAYARWEELEARSN